jgi:NtrC-family two-component system sensor histidine kinase KinB
MTHSQIAGQSLGDLRPDSLLRIAAAIETAVTLDELLMLGLNEIAKLLDLANSGVILLSDGGQRAQLASTSPPRRELPPPFALAETTVLQRVVAERQSMQISVSRDLAKPGVGPATLQLLPLLSAEEIESLLLIPLVAQDSCLGVLVFASVGTPRHFSPGEVAHARLLAGQFAAAITSFRTTEKAERRTAELATLNDIAAAVTSSLDTREVYHLVMQKINEYFRVEAGSLLMLDEETEELVFVMTLEAGEEKLFGVRVPRGQGIVWSVAEAQRYDIVNDAQNDPRFFRDVSDSVGYEVSTILCVPILVKGRTIGVIELLNKREGHFTEEEAVRLMRMAATIGVAIENARLFQTVTTVRDRLEAILNSTNDGILMADMRDVVVTANPAAARLLQAHSDALIGRPLNAVLSELRARAGSVSAPSWLNDGSDEVVELELASPQRCFLRHYLLPVCEASGAQIGRLALFQDVSKARELEQLREDYTGMLVHDLRAPLTAIMNGIMMVKRGLGGPIAEQQQELLGIAHQGSQTMLEMINTLLDIAKLEQGHMTLNCEPLSPYAVVDQTLDRLRVVADGQRVNLGQELAVGLPLVEADREKLVRVLQNLLDNAIKFSPVGGTVTLGAWFVRIEAGQPAEPGSLPIHLPKLVDGDWLMFWVRDQGPGIPAQFHERVFEKFGQVRGGRKIRGTGLGLTFCKLAVEAHGGKIWLQSSEGSGSTFALVLPLSPEQPRQSQIASSGQLTSP